MEYSLLWHFMLNVNLVKKCQLSNQKIFIYRKILKTQEEQPLCILQEDTACCEKRQPVSTSRQQSGPSSACVRHRFSWSPVWSIRPRTSDTLVSSRSTARLVRPWANNPTWSNWSSAASIQRHTDELWRKSSWRWVYCHFNSVFHTCV